MAVAKGFNNKLSSLRLYLKSLYRFSPGQTIVALLLMLSNTLIGGVGLLFLVPLLHYTGWLSSSNHYSSVLDKLLHFLPATQGGALPLLVTLLLFIFIISFFALFNYYGNLVQTRLMQSFLLQLRQEFNAAVAKAQWSYLLEQKLKHIEHMLSAGLGSIAVLTLSTLRLVSSAIVIVAYVIFSLVLSPALTLISMLCGLIVLKVFHKSKAELMGQRNFYINQKMHSEAANFLSGLKLTKVQNVVNAYLSRYTSLAYEAQTNQVAFNRQQRRVAALFNIAGAVIFALLFYISVHWLHTSLITMLALLVIYARLFSQLSTFQQTLLQVLNSVPTFIAFKKMQSEFKAHCESLPEGLTSCRLYFKHIHLKQISFSHQNHFALQTINFTIAANTTTAIVGHSGAGKSTLVDLLIGLFQPHAGHIYLDDLCLTPEQLSAWRNSLSYVPQETFLFNDTIRNNLLWLAPEATDKDIWLALEQAAAKDFVQQLPQQLNTCVGDAGIHLSGGERQRLAIARALLRKPSLLILDEATSALDGVNESVIFQTLEKLHGKLTVILIAHRFSSVRLADQILVMDGGRLVEQGPLHTLLNASDSHFMQLFSAQLANVTEYNQTTNRVPQQVLSE